MKFIQFTRRATRDTGTQGHRDTGTRPLEPSCHRLPAPCWKPTAPPLDPPAPQPAPLALDDPVLQVLPAILDSTRCSFRFPSRYLVGKYNSEYRKVTCCLPSYLLLPLLAAKHHFPPLQHHLLLHHLLILLLHPVTLLLRWAGPGKAHVH